MARPVKTQKFNGVKYEIDVEPILGATQDPHPKTYIPVIRVVNGLPYGNCRGARTGLDVIIHEALHASNFNAHEETVERAAREVSKLLWRLGYRRAK